MQTRTLQGIIRITEPDEYTLVLPNTLGTSLPNALANQVLDEVFIVIDEFTPPYTLNIYLPKISDFKGAWNPKIYILNKNANGIPTLDTTAILISYSDEFYSDYFILNSPYIDLIGADSANTLLHIIDNNIWGVFGGLRR
jgi:hypothetical protein